MSTPVFSNVFRLGVMCGAEKVSQLINRPVMILFGKFIEYYESTK
jgi:hypothetical protein